MTAIAQNTKHPDTIISSIRSTGSVNPTRTVVPLEPTVIA